MRFTLRAHRPSHVTVVAYLALFVALGGSSYAALKVTSRNVPKDALTGADIKNLTGRDVRNNSLTGADVAKLTSADVANGRLLAEDFAQGQLPAGPRGPQGAAGAALAFAAVTTAGDVQEEFSKNVADANVTRTAVGSGTYCFDGLGFKATNVIASVRGQQNRWIYAILGGGLDCEDDDDAVVKTGLSGATPSDGAFSILFN